MFVALMQLRELQFILGGPTHLLILTVPLILLASITALRVRRMIRHHFACSLGSDKIPWLRQTQENRRTVAEDSDPTAHEVRVGPQI